MNKRVSMVLGKPVSVFLVLASCMAPSGWSATGKASSLSERVDLVFADYNNRTPGCSLGVIQDGELVLERGYGMANLEHGLSLDSQSVLRIGSTSKQFTTATIQLLAQEGKLSLDDEIHKYFPEFKKWQAPVTVRHLIHHTSGLRDYLGLMAMAGARDLDYYSDQEVLDILALQNELNFGPGSEFLYSNSGYFLLGQIVLRVTGETLAEVADKRIFQPLGMKHTHFHDDSTRIVERRASGYAPSKDGGGFVVSMTTLPMIGDGGVFTTVQDLLLWDRNFYTGEVGGDEFLAAMHRRGVLNDGEPIAYAGGLFYGDMRGLPTVSHGGAFVGFRAELLRFPEQKTSVVCLCNRADANPSQLARQVAAVYLDGIMEPAAESQEPKQEDGEDATAVTSVLGSDAPQPSTFVGTYRSAELPKPYRISLNDGGGLDLEVGNELDGELERDGATVFKAAEGWLTLEFSDVVNGRSSGFVVQAGRVKNIRFTRE